MKNLFCVELLLLLNKLLLNKLLIYVSIASQESS